MSNYSAAAIEPVLRNGVVQFGTCRIGFQRTLRIPDDGREYPLPPGLGHFPILPVDQYADRVPDDWRQHGGVFIPMHQREALWIDFTGSYGPSAVKVGIGKVNAVTGEPWSDELHARSPGRKQDYLVVPNQPWLDGINVGNGRIRQFVAVPLGSDYTVEGQVTGDETWGGIQLLVVPSKPRPKPAYSVSAARGGMLKRIERARPAPDAMASPMGLGAGGTMTQRIYDDTYGIHAWDQAKAARLFVHIANAELFTEITGKAPPRSPVSAQSYSDVGLPWFDLYDADRAFVAGSDPLMGVWSIADLDEAKIGPAAPRDPSIELGGQVVKLGPTPGSLRDGEW